jgi:ADP-ribosylation factor-like protein 8
MWERYCRGVQCIVYVVDAQDQAKLSSSKTEFYSLIEKPILKGIPVLLLGNKMDLEGSLSAEELIELFGLRNLSEREVACYAISAKNSTNLDKVLSWLMKHAA